MAAETEQNATAPATSGAIDYDRLSQAIGGAVAKAVEPLNAKIAQLEARAGAGDAAAGGGKGAAGAKDSAADAGAEKPLTRKELADLLDAREQTRNVRDQKSRYIGEKLKDLPAVYANQLGADPARWPDEEQAIRKSYREDLKARGFKVPDLGGGEGGGAAAGTIAAAGAVDYSKLTGSQLIELGLKNSKPARLAQAPAASA